MDLWVNIAQISSAAATIVIAFLTLIQSHQNSKTLKEAKESRSWSVAPQLNFTKGAKVMGIFDDDVSYLSDLDILVTEKEAETQQICFHFNITVDNIGKGPAYNFTCNSFGNFSIHVEKRFSIIKPEDSVQLKFVLYNFGTIPERCIVYFSYENSFGEKFQQKALIVIKSLPFIELERIEFDRPIKNK